MRRREVPGNAGKKLDARGAKRRRQLIRGPRHIWGESWTRPTGCRLLPAPLRTHVYLYIAAATAAAAACIIYFRSSSRAPSTRQFVEPSISWLPASRSGSSSVRVTHRQRSTRYSRVGGGRTRVSSATEFTYRPVLDLTKSGRLELASGRL